MKTMMKLGSMAAVGLALCLARNTLAADYTWNGAGGDGLWNNPNNWVGGVVPQVTDPTAEHRVWLNTGVITIPAGYTVDLTAATNYGTIYGPEWGGDLYIYGALKYYWTVGPVGGLDNPSVINMYTNSYMSGDSIALGQNWWWNGGPGVIMNMYDNAEACMNSLYLGGRLNMYGGILNVTNVVITDNVGACSDATRSLNLMAGGMVVLPAGYTGTVNDWISRGILLVYDIPYNSAEIVIDEANTNWPDRTVLTTTATGAPALLAVRIEVPRAGLSVGGLEQAQVYADFTTITNANVTFTAAITKTYGSGDTNVLTVTPTGLVRAVGLGTASVQVAVGALSNSVAVTVSAYTNTATLAHRYNFDEAAGTSIAADSIGGPSWDGMLIDIGASFNGTGQLVLDGTNVGYVMLPSGIITNMEADAVSVETWLSFNMGSISNWAVLFAFGDSDGQFGHHYLSCQPHTGGATAQTGIKSSPEQNAWFTPVLDGYNNLHLVAVFHPEAGHLSIYTNGVLAAINPDISITIAEAMATGDPYNFIGKSMWSADPYLPATIDEFRIYRGPLSGGEIRANNALGPNQFSGTNTNVSLSAALSGSNIVITWPANSALVDLISSPVLGSGAVWTSVTAVPIIESGDYKVTVPATDSARYFRLRK
jgi:hypothetical protein